MARRKMKTEPWADEGRDPLELLARLLVNGSYRVPTEGRSTLPALGSSDIAAAVGYMPDALEKHVALGVATRVPPAAVARLSVLAYRRVAAAVRLARPRPLDLSAPVDRWRLRLVIYDAAHELIYPEGLRPYGELAKLAKTRKAAYIATHRIATAVLQEALCDGRREFHRRLFKA